MNFLKQNRLVLILILALILALVVNTSGIKDQIIPLLDNAVAYFTQDSNSEPPLPPDDYKIPDQRNLPLVDVAPEISVSDSIVTVTNYMKGITLSGYGVVIKHKGNTFVLTSRTILSKGVGNVTVNDLPAGVVAEDEIWELALLRIYKGDVPAIELRPFGGEGDIKVITDRGYPVTVKRHARSSKSPRTAHQNWLILAGAPDACSGAPIFTGDTITGLVIGQSTRISTETIAANKVAILKLLERVK